MPPLSQSQLFEILEDFTSKINTPSFIESDPICIPHRYHHRPDIEVTGLWTALLAWGQRKTIINKASALFALMGESPHDFILHHRPIHRKRFQHFVHRTFQYTDTLYFLEFLQHFYRSHDTLEDLFAGHRSLSQGLCHFHDSFFSLDQAPKRTRKHVPTPSRKSTCKRVNMFLRWMVRSDNQGVDFGLWKRIKPADLYIPLDVHVDRMARRLNLLQRKQRDWQAVEELTTRLRSFDPDDPAKYDFALFGMGVASRNGNHDILA